MCSRPAAGATSHSAPPHLGLSPQETPQGGAVTGLPIPGCSGPQQTLCLPWRWTGHLPKSHTGAHHSLCYRRSSLASLQHCPVHAGVGSQPGTPCLQHLSPLVSGPVSDPSSAPTPAEKLCPLPQGCPAPPPSWAPPSCRALHVGLPTGLEAHESESRAYCVFAILACHVRGTR